MRLFGIGVGGTPEDPQAAARRQASEQSMAQGGLPLNAIDRLKEQAARQGLPGHIFTSDLSVNELALMDESAYDALGQVMGSTIYNVGWQYMPSGWGWGSGELTVLTQAFYEARHLALGRLQQEAALLGATGVVGVRIEKKQYEWGSHMLEFAAFGTAIREKDTPHPGVGGPLPFVSDLSGQEFWTLRQSGFRPVGFALGNCTWYQIPSWSTQYATTGGIFGGGWTNQELPDFTAAVYEARALAMERMEVEARAVGASGIVGADVDLQTESREVEYNNQQRIDMIFHFTAMGTAIAPYTGRWPAFTVQIMQSLAD